MKKINKMQDVYNQQLNLNQLIRGKATSNEPIRNYLELDQEFRQECFNLIKNYLLGKCRVDSKPYQNIKGVELDKLEEYGIFNRLVVEFAYKSNKIQANYIVGQDAPSEYRTLKKLFKNH